jgi:hypothetical protein
MRAMVVEEYGTARDVCEVADPAGPAADVLAASLNPVDAAAAAGLNPLRRPELLLVLGLDGVARRADEALLHFSSLRRPTAPSPSGCRWRKRRPYRNPLLRHSSRNHQNLSARTGEGHILADAPEPLTPYIERGRP